MSPASLLAASLAMLAAVSPAFADEAGAMRTLALTGHGEVRLAPDMATVTAGVLSQAATARDALTANNRSMAALLDALKSAGISEKDIQTSNFSVAPRYDYNNNTQPPKLVGYDVSNSVSVMVRQLDALGPVLDQLVTAGSNQISGIAFGIAEPDAALDEARKLAVADAARKAKIYTEAAGVTLGPITSISESGGFAPPMPHVKAMRMEAADAAVPIAQGEQSLSIDVNIVWDIK